MTKRVLVTGASSGIGFATVKRLLDDGWEVIGLSRRLVDILDDNFTSVQADLMDEESLMSVLPTLGDIDAFIHAAGKMEGAELGELDTSQSSSLWWLHVHVPELIANYFAPKLKHGSRIVLLGSRTSKGAKGRSQYVATKSALIGMTRSWAMELAPRGITVNVVAPGATDTPMLSDPRRSSVKPKVPPIGRLIQPEEVANCVSFLLSPMSGVITGQEITICGGASLL